MDDVTLDASTLTANATAGNIALLTVSGTAKSKFTLIAGGDIAAGDLTLNDSSFSATTTIGNITLSIVDARNGSAVTLKAGTVSGSGGDILTGNVLLVASKFEANATAGSLTLGLLTANTGSGAMLCAGTDIGVGDVALDASTLTTTAGEGSLTLGLLTLTDHSSASLTALGDIGVKTVALDRSTLTAIAGGDIAADDITALSSALTFTADGDIAFPNLTSAAGTIAMTAGGRVAFNRADLGGSAVKIATWNDDDASTSGDITFDIAEGIDTALELLANGGGLFGIDGASYLFLRGASSLKLSALGDIGRADRRLIVDIPAEITLRVAAVDNYYIDSVELVGETKFARTRPAVNIGGGRDAGGMNREGDWLKDGGSDALYPALDAQTPEELAAWIAARSARDAWTGLITEQALRDMIRSGAIAKSALKSLLVTTAFPEKNFNTAYGNKQYDVLASMLKAVLGVAPPDPAAPPATPVKYVADQQALGWLAAAIGKGAVADLGTVIHDSMKQDDLEALLEKAWMLADYAGRLADKPEDPAARAFCMEIGESLGEGHVRNAGDIAIVQIAGDLTAADIHSARGDVSLTAELGSILGASSPVANVRGTHITLNAHGSIGSAAQPLTTEQQNTRTALVGNIVEPTTGSDGKYAFTLVRRPVLDALGQPVLDKLGQPLYTWNIEVEVVYDWLRAPHTEEETRLDAAAGGDLFIRELTGGMGIGILSAGGDVGLHAPGSLLDVRGSDEAALNLAAGGDASLTSETGTIGLKDGYLDIDVGGVVTAAAAGDINLNDMADLALVADSTSGQVNADAVGKLTLSNTAGNLVIGPIHAGGDIEITAQGSILPGDRLGRAEQVKGRSIAMSALGGTIGTAAAPMLVDTDAADGGTLSIDAAGTAYVRELTGDVLLKELKSGASATLIVPGSVFDANEPIWDEVAQKLLETNRLYGAYREKATIAQVLRAYADEFLAVLTAASGKVTALQQALADLGTGMAALQAQIDALAGDPEKAAELKLLTGQLAGLKNQATALTGRLDAALVSQASAQAAFDPVDLKAKAAEDEADGLSDIYEASLLNMLARATDAASRNTIDAAGDLLIVSGGSVGQTGHALSMKVGGLATIRQTWAPANELSIASGGDITLSGIDVGGNASVISLGSIRIAPGKTVKAQATSLFSMFGDVGTSTNPIVAKVRSISAAGVNVYLKSDGAMTIDTIIAKNLASIASGGAVSGVARAAGDLSPHISAAKLVMYAKRDIGSPANLLKLDVGALTMVGDDISLNNISGTLTIQRLRGDRVLLYALGNVMGGVVRANRLRISAYGSVGKKGNPLRIWVPGSVRITSTLGHVYYVNLYEPPVVDVQVLYMLRFPVTLNIGGVPLRFTLYISVAVGTNTFSVLGAWLMMEETPEAVAAILEQLKALGVANVPVACVGALPGFAEALAQEFPGAVLENSVLAWVIQAALGADIEDIEPLLSDLERILTAEDAEAGMLEIARFAELWGEKYPEIAAQIAGDWPETSDFFADPAAHRKVAYRLGELARFIVAVKEVLEREEGFSSEEELMDALEPVFLRSFLPQG